MTITNIWQDIAEAKAHLEQLEQEQVRLDREVSETTTRNSQLEEHVADLIKETKETDRMKHWVSILYKGPNKYPHR